MALPVYSVRLAAVQGLNVPLTYGPVPSGFVWVLRDLDAYYNGLVGTQLFLRGSVGQTIWTNTFAAASGPQYASWRGRQVIEPGETFALQAADNTDVTVSGYVLSAP